MTTEISKMKERITRLEKWKRRVTDILALVPEATNPLDWDSLDLFDKELYKLFLQGVSLSTTEMGKKLKVSRVKIWRKLKKIQRVSQRLKGDPIVVYDLSMKKWKLNTEEFEFKGLEKKNENPDLAYL